MRKNKLSIFTLYLFFLLSFLFNLIKVDAFLDEDSGLDLYNNIESGIDDLELKYYEANITDGGSLSIAERINAIAGKECIDESITIEDFNKIALGNTKILNNFILDECKENDGEQTDISVITEFLGGINKLSREAKANAEEKTRITYNIARLGLYSDGNTDNSPYDIIKDLEDINGIIFSHTDDTKYEGTDDTSLSDFFSSPSGQSILSSNTLKQIEALDINEDSSNCDDFFCIKIEYSKYEHTLFGGGKSKDKSLEGLVKNSNKHLYKYANTSLIQHQITLDNWELSIKNMKLKDIFNQNIIVFSRNIPIINKDKNNVKEKEIKEKSPFGYKSQLEHYYELHNLEYEKANSIDNFNNRLSETISINDSLGIDISDSTKRYKSSYSYSASNKENEVYLNKILSTKQRNDNINGLYGLFIELESFTNTFEQYVKGVFLQVKSMNKKASR